MLGILEEQERDYILTEPLTHCYAMISGTVSTNLLDLYEDFGELFLVVEVISTRLSGAEDRIPVTIPSYLLPNGILAGMRIRVEGEIRTYNRTHNNGKNYVDITLFATRLQFATYYSDENLVRIQGVICKRPIFRISPFGKEITEFTLAVNRGYGKSSYIPCISWGKIARIMCGLRVGEPVEIEGRFQSRQYQKMIQNGIESTIETRTTYEVSTYKYFRY